MESLRGVCTALVALTFVAASAGSARADDAVTRQMQTGSAPPPAAQPAPPPPTLTVPPPEPASTHSIWPALLIGSGVAELGTGIIMAVTAPKLPSGCDSSTNKCTRVPGETQAQLSDRQDRAAESEGLKTAGYILVGVGLASITGGIVWCLLEEKSASSSAAGWTKRVAPWATAGGGGLVTGGTF